MPVGAPDWGTWLPVQVNQWIRSRLPYSWKVWGKNGAGYQRKGETFKLWDLSGQTYAGVRWASSPGATTYGYIDFDLYYVYDLVCINFAVVMWDDRKEQYNRIKLYVSEDGENWRELADTGRVRREARLMYSDWVKNVRFIRVEGEGYTDRRTWFTLAGFECWTER